MSERRETVGFRYCEVGESEVGEVGERCESAGLRYWDIGESSKCSVFIGSGCWCGDICEEAGEATCSLASLSSPSSCMLPSRYSSCETRFSTSWTTWSIVRTDDVSSFMLALRLRDIRLPSVGCSDPMLRVSDQSSGSTLTGGSIGGSPGTGGISCFGGSFCGILYLLSMYLDGGAGSSGIGSLSHIGLVELTEFPSRLFIRELRAVLCIDLMSAVGKKSAK